MSSSSHHNHPASRISLACVPCRSRHLRCDGTLPACSRCVKEESECTWQKSRRGGRPRKRIPGSTGAATTAQNTAATAVSSNGGTPAMAGSLANSTPSSLQEPADMQFDLSGLSYASSNSGWSRPHSGGGGGGDDILLDLYYEHYHPAHPSCLPRPYLEACANLDRSNTNLLIKVMRWIGSFYASDIPSEPLHDEIKMLLRENPSCSGPWQVHAFMIYGSGVVWSEDYIAGSRLVKAAAQEAIRIGMYMEHFVRTMSEGDPVLAESWRRTWWHLYLVEVHISAIMHAPDFTTSLKNVTPTVGLPCEEAEYEAGEITSSRSIEDYESREMDLEQCDYSSFAQLIGLSRGMDRYVLGQQRISDVSSKNICTNADSMTAAWQFLLPESKRQLFNKEGIFDPMMFKAKCILPVYSIDVHRALSTLEFDEIESISGCAPPPPIKGMSQIFVREAPTHTARILRDLDDISRLLTQCPSVRSLSPWLICMVSSTIIVHLSACRHVLRPGSSEMQVARERIRAAIGVIQSLSDVWAIGKKILHEVKVIAQKQLGLNRMATPQRSADLSVSPGLSVEGGNVSDAASGVTGSDLQDMNFSFEGPGSEWFFSAPASVPMPDSERNAQVMSFSQSGFNIAVG